MNELRDETMMLGAPPPACGVKAGGAADLAPAPLSAADRNAPVADFADPCDNSEYQWFLEYNPLLRESSCHHTSVLSSLSASYKGIGDLTSRFDFSSRYDDLARDLDVNLAEADMESFKTQDIHALLMTANPHDAIVQHDEHDSNRRGEMFASISNSLMEKFRFDCSISPPSSSQGDSTAGSINTMSLCKSELLFSPVRDAPHPAVHYSIDSLDCDLLNEQDLILTCQANKDNYTIAFEGSLTTYSEDSELGDAAVDETNDNIDRIQERITSDLYNLTKRAQKNVAMLQPTLEQGRSHSMARSDTGFTTWTKLKKQYGQSPTRYPSGNNNGDSGDSNNLNESIGGEVLKSQSLPDLFRRRMRGSMLSSASNSTIESFCGQRDGYMKVYDVSQTQPDAMSTSSDPNTDQRQGFSLVKLFMKQKSGSNEGMATDHSGSECWPNSSGGESGDSYGPDKKHGDAPICASDRSNNENIYEELTQNRTDYTSTFEDSLQRSTETNATATKCIYNTNFIEEEDPSQINEESEALCDDESHLYATVNKPLQRRMNLTNNNVLETNNKCHSPMRFRSTLSRKSCSSMSSGTSVSISSCSESEGTQLTKLQRIPSKDVHENKATSTRLSYSSVDRSMQTSLQASSYTKDSGLIKVVVPSFLEKLKRGGCEKPVYVLYPNYTLPDLSFMNQNDSYEKIMLKPQKFNHVDDKTGKRKSIDMLSNRRPFSCNDLEALRKKGFGHIRDWDSLTFLLPTEYKKLLSEVPEVVQKLKDQESEAAVFNRTAQPTRHKARPASCDCSSLGNNHTNVSSSSSTATQPSSGYRGSSTMLTDSSAQNSPAPAPNFNPLFVYRYDSATSSDASFLTHDRQKSNPPRRPVSAAEQAKIAANGRNMEAVPPRPPLPKSILRKSAEKMRKNTVNTKRYSMFEMDELIRDPVTCMNLETEQKTTKRRSLQEPYYLLKNNSIVEMRKNAELAGKRISRQFSDDAATRCDEYFCDEGVGTESSLESAKSNEAKTLHRPRQPPLPKPRTRSSGTDPMAFPPAGALISSADLQQLEQLLSQSGVSCQNMEEWDRVQMQKVRNQVSNFLSMKRSREENERSTDWSGSSNNCGSRKSVSFANRAGRKKSGDNSLKVIQHVKVASLATPPNSPNMTAMMSQRQCQAKNLSELAICEEGEVSPDAPGSPARDGKRRQPDIDISQKRALVSRVTDAVEELIVHFSVARSQDELVALGDCARSPDVARLALHKLCPALYDVFTDGLHDNIHTSFGDARNSVWQVVEASARQGPITKALNELVLRINSEDAISEGLVKFNAFILGLLNSSSVAAWVSYVRTRQSVLSRHYGGTSLLARGGDAACRALLDTLLASLEPLALLPFRLDLLHQMRHLHATLQRIQPHNPEPANINLPSLTIKQRNLLKLVQSVQSSTVSSDDQKDETGSQVSVILRHKPEPSTPDLLNDSAGTRTLCSVDKVRPRSCVNPSMDCPSNSRIEVEQNRRWSGVQLGSKLIQAFDKLVMYDDSDEYTDSLENQKAGGNLEHVGGGEGENRKYGSSCGSGVESCGDGECDAQATPPRATFKRLQLRWEMLSNGDSSPGEQSPVTSRGSRIPRPVTSPSRPQTLTLTSPAKTVHRSIPVPVKKASPCTPPGPPNPRIAAPTRATPVAKRPMPSRASRLEQPAGTGAPRPASLPHGRAPAAPHAPPKRRAASSDLARGGPAPATPNKQTHKPKMVRTLWHRLPSDSGHLAFSEGERLRLVLEVDQQWLLCCRGDRKGLVPRNAVMPVHDT